MASNEKWKMKEDSALRKPPSFLILNCPFYIVLSVDASRPSFTQQMKVLFLNGFERQVTFTVKGGWIAHVFNQGSSSQPKTTSEANEC